MPKDSQIAPVVSLSLSVRSDCQRAASYCWLPCNSQAFDEPALCRIFVVSLPTFN